MSNYILVNSEDTQIADRSGIDRIITAAEQHIQNGLEQSKKEIAEDLRYLGRAKVNCSFFKENSLWIYKV